VASCASDRQGRSAGCAHSPCGATSRAPVKAAASFQIIDSTIGPLQALFAGFGLLVAGVPGTRLVTAFYFMTAELAGAS
jgi:hypothetical protein